MVSNTTVEKTSSKEIPMRSPWHDKVHVSVCLTEKTDGTKLKPFIVFKGTKRESKALHDEFRRQCSRDCNGNKATQLFCVIPAVTPHICLSV